MKNAIEAWKPPLYAPHYHQTGFLHLVSGSAPEKAIGTLSRFVATIRDHPLYQNHIQDVATRDDIRNIAWQYDGAFRNWKGYFNRRAGYAHAANALLAVYKAAAARGVKFFTGDERGWVTALVHDSRNRVIGVRTRAGHRLSAALTIVAAGAAAATLVPEAAQQVVAKSLMLIDDPCSLHYSDYRW